MDFAKRAAQRPSKPPASGVGSGVIEWQRGLSQTRMAAGLDREPGRQSRCGRGWLQASTTRQPAQCLVSRLRATGRSVTRRRRIAADWHARLTCFGCGSRRVDFVVTGTERR
jgi:hypothetical protein